VRLSSLAAAASFAIVVGVALTGCSTTVNLDPAEGANDPACAELSVRLPGSVAEQPRRWTDAQATGAWGEPSAVLLRCGVTPPGPTEARCITIGGVDWIVDESQAPRYLVTTYGREPAVEVFVDNEVVSPNDVLGDLGLVVSGTTTADSACTLTETLLPED
jgi:hypothetical protein